MPFGDIGLEMETARWGAQGRGRATPGQCGGVEHETNVAGCLNPDSGAPELRPHTPQLHVDRQPGAPSGRGPIAPPPLALLAGVIWAHCELTGHPHTGIGTRVGSGMRQPPTEPHPAHAQPHTDRQPGAPSGARGEGRPGGHRPSLAFGAI